MRHSKMLLIITIIFALTLVSGQVLAAGDYDIGWVSLGGSVQTSVSNTYSMYGISGQAQAGELTGGSYTLRGGYYVLPLIVEDGGAIVYLPVIMH